MFMFSNEKRQQFLIAVQYSASSVLAQYQLFTASAHHNLVPQRLHLGRKRWRSLLLLLLLMLQLMRRLQVI